MVLRVRSARTASVDLRELRVSRGPRVRFRPMPAPVKWVCLVRMVRRVPRVSAAIKDVKVTRVSVVLLASEVSVAWVV